MGMFDYFYSSCDLGEGFTNVECQTKEIEDYGIGGSMSHFWLDPSGHLFVMTYRNTHTFNTITKDDERYNSTHLFLNYEWIPTGEHGRVEPYRLTKYVEVYPSIWKGKWEEWPRLKIHFKDGMLVEYSPCKRGETRQL
ncbi:MAG: hypothetical protein ACO236_04330 [Candidatus Nanopelagicaceae bacterium]